MKRAALFGALVVAAVAAAFSPALENGFVGWDDDVYLVENESFRGLGAAQVKSAFTSTRMGHYHPLTWLSYGVDYSLGGLEPAVYHAGNVLLHALAALFFFMACRKVLGDEAAAAAAALFFGLHPLRVESVAWASERKDVLAAAFLCAAFWAHVERRRAWRAALFAASLASKASGMAFPFALLLLDARRGRLERKDIVEKAPLFALSAASAAVSLWALSDGGLLRGGESRGAAMRLGQAAYGFWFYLWKTLVPAGLLPHYAPPDWFGRWAPAAALAAAALAAFALLRRLRRREPALAVAAYAVLAAPILGAVQSGVPYAACDRYSYLPALPLSLLAGAALLRAPLLRYGTAAALALCLGLLTWRQCGVWRDTATLWSTVAEAQPRNALALQNLGAMAAHEGRLAEAEAYFRRAVDEGRPSYPAAHEGLGSVLALRGMPEAAQEAWRRGLESAPGEPRLSARLGRLRADETLLRAAFEKGETSAGVALGELLAAAGRGAEARAAYEAVLAKAPKDGAARNNLGLLLHAQGLPLDARREFGLALRDASVRPQAHYNLGNLLMHGGDFAGALRHYERSATAKADVNRANVLAAGGRLAEAEALYLRALKKEPGLMEARLNLSAVRQLKR